MNVANDTLWQHTSLLSQIGNALDKMKAAFPGTPIGPIARVGMARTLLDNLREQYRAVAQSPD